MRASPEGEVLSLVRVKSNTINKKGTALCLYNWYNVSYLMDLFSADILRTENIYWVNLSKRGGKYGVFQGLSGLLRGISFGLCPREIPQSSPASPWKAPSFLTLLFRFTFYF